MEHSPHTSEIKCNVKMKIVATFFTSEKDFEEEMYSSFCSCGDAGKLKPEGDESEQVHTREATAAEMDQDAAESDLVVHTAFYL